MNQPRECHLFRHGLRVILEYGPQNLLRLALLLGKGRSPDACRGAVVRPNAMVPAAEKAAGWHDVT